jgi:hypothetical protein
LRVVAADGPAPGGEAENGERFILDQLPDRLDTLRLLREDDPQRADVMLEQFGAAGARSRRCSGTVSGGR